MVVAPGEGGESSPATRPIATRNVPCGAFNAPAATEKTSRRTIPVSAAPSADDQYVPAPANFSHPEQNDRPEWSLHCLSPRRRFQGVLIVAFDLRDLSQSEGSAVQYWRGNFCRGTGIINRRLLPGTACGRGPLNSRVNLRHRDFKPPRCGSSLRSRGPCRSESTRRRPTVSRSSQSWAGLAK